MRLTRDTLPKWSKWSQEQINFLNVAVSVENRKIKTNFHAKRTDTHRYLHFCLCNPYHCKRGIHYSLCYHCMFYF